MTTWTKQKRAAASARAKQAWANRKRATPATPPAALALSELKADRANAHLRNLRAASTPVDADGLQAESTAKQFQRYSALMAAIVELRDAGMIGSEAAMDMVRKITRKYQ